MPRTLDFRACFLGLSASQGPPIRVSPVDSACQSKVQMSLTSDCTPRMDAAADEIVIRHLPGPERVLEMA